MFVPNKSGLLVLKN